MQHTRAHPRVLILIFALAMALIAPLGTAAAHHSIDESAQTARLTNSAIAAELFESVFNDHDGDAAARLIAADAVIVTPDRLYTGPQGFMGYLATIRHTYRDASFEVTSFDILQDDSVVLQWTMTATRYMVDPHEEPIDVRASMSGQTTIAVTDGQIATVVQAPEEVAFLPDANVTLITGDHVALIGGHVVWA